MATIAAIKAANDAAIRNKVLPSSVTRANVSDRLDACADELQSRGMHISPDTATLATIAGADTDKVFVPGIGLFQYSASGSPNGTTIFAALDTGTWNLKGLTEFYTGTTRKLQISANGRLEWQNLVAGSMIFNSGMNHEGGAHALDIRNLAVSNAAGVGFAFRNDVGTFFQVQKGSNIYSFIPNGTLIRDNGGGLCLAADGVGAKIFLTSGFNSASAYAELNSVLANFKGVPIATVEPSANGAGSWKLGKAIGADGVGATTFLEIDVDGTPYILTAKVK